MCISYQGPPLSTIDRSKRLECRVPKGLTRRGAFALLLVFFLRLLLLLRIPPPNSSSFLTLHSSFPGCGGSRVRLRGRSSCSVGGGGLMACAVSIGCVAALRPPHDLGPSRPKRPTLPGSEGSLFLPRAGWSAGADGNTDLRLPPSSLSSSAGQGSSRLLRLAEFTPRSVSSISFPQIVFLREPRPQLPSPFKGVGQPNDIYQTPTSTSDERGREG